ncbi:hypothetical protein C8Q78DRAFT_384516 [Trametes maxima]|nr:hypothetical protein C8Q78DRAFT_384516 [Trametes maxima]
MHPVPVAGAVSPTDLVDVLGTYVHRRCTTKIWTYSMFSVVPTIRGRRESSPARETPSTQESESVCLPSAPGAMALSSRADSHRALRPQEHNGLDRQQMLQSARGRDRAAVSTSGLDMTEPVVALMEYYVCHNRRPAYPIQRDEQPERAWSTRSEVPAAPALSVPWFFMAIDEGAPSHGSRSEPMGPHCLPVWTSVKLTPNASGRGGAMLARNPEQALDGTPSAEGRRGSSIRRWAALSRLCECIAPTGPDWVVGGSGR